MEAANDGEVVARLQEQGHLPVEAKLASEGVGRVGVEEPVQAQALRRRRLVQFTQQLATLLGAGQPLDRALTILLELPEDEAARAPSPTSAMRCAAAARCRRRWNASTARSRGSTSTWCAPVRPAAALHETLERLAEYLERTRALRGPRGQRADLSGDPAGGGRRRLLFLLGYVVPQFARCTKASTRNCRFSRRIVLGIGLFVRDWWIVIWSRAGARGVVVRSQATRSRLPRRASTRGCCGSRFVGATRGAGLRPRAWRARWARWCAMACRCSPRWASAATCSATACWPADVEAAAQEVKNGVGLSTALGRGKRFPRLALQMIQVGEESGALDAMLLEDRRDVRAGNRAGTGPHAGRAGAGGDDRAGRGRRHGRSWPC